MIAELIAEYNQAEAEQRERLETLFRLLDERKGFRRVKFSNGRVWSNCWGSPERLSIPQHVHPVTARIDQIDEGNE